ncbi:hypothetical protein F5Y12DRAFT_722482 [Xylaria sp. FL1777]|nr:hypothetical protein F5Y12DRAFT_722482 [Xylaria sp. FL1777]
MASLNINAPGAYPATPINEEPKRQTQPSGHDFTKDTPRSLSNDVHSSGRYFDDSDIYLDDESSSSEGAKPGVVTGAYSRVGVQDSPLKQNANYTYDNTSTTQSPRSRDLSQFDEAKRLDTPINVVAPSNTPAEVTNLDSHSSTANPKGNALDVRNTVQTGLRGKSNAEHKDPYWGSIPFGVGVYNGVTGHGSNETTTHQKSLDGPDSNTTTNSGSAGYDSKESSSPHVSKYDQAVTTDEPTRQHRAFPLVNSAETKTGVKSNDANEYKYDSRLKGAFAGAGTAAAGGYAAHEYSKRGRTNETKATEATFRDEKPSKVDQTTSHAVLNSRSHKDKEAAPLVYRSQKNQTLMPQQPLDTANEENRRDDSKLGYYGAAVAATGAGAYGTHKYADRDGAREKSSLSETKEAVALSRGEMREETQAEPQGVVLNTTREQPQYKTLANGTSSGIASEPFDSNLSNPSQTGRRKVVPTSVPSSNTTDETRDAGRSSSDSSHGGQYNVLASGTPSGINLEHLHHSH